MIPNESKIIFNNQQYYLENNGDASFSYTFLDVQKPITFFVESNGIQSQNYKIIVIGTPRINNITLDVVYPKYLRRKNKTIQNSGNLTVPEGTNIIWKLKLVKQIN